MTANDIKSLLIAEPFQPFTIRYKTGQEFDVPRADYAWVPPITNGSAVYVSDGKGSFDMLDASWITEVIAKRPKPRRRKAG